jgi:hypothetical protein
MTAQKREHELRRLPRGMTCPALKEEAGWVAAAPPPSMRPAGMYTASMETTTRLLDLQSSAEPPSDGQAPGEIERARLLLYQYERCCDDWRHHDAIIWEMPIATLTANAVIVWAATAHSRPWVMTMAWAIAAVMSFVMSLGLRKQVLYARQIGQRIRAIEDEFAMPRVTTQVGPRGLISTLMVWTLRLTALADLVIAVLTAVYPHLMV